MLCLHLLFSEQPITPQLYPSQNFLLYNQLLILHLPSTIYNMSDGNASTGQSYLDQATGLAQRAMGTVTGDSSTQVSLTVHHIIQLS